MPLTHAQHLNADFVADIVANRSTLHCTRDRNYNSDAPHCRLPQLSGEPLVLTGQSASDCRINSAATAAACRIRKCKSAALLADRTNGRAYVASSVCLSVSLSSSVTLCIVAKRCVLEQKLLLTAYRKSHMRNCLVPKSMTLFRGCV